MAVRRPATRKVHGPRFDGAREVDRYLREIGARLPKFCEEKGLDRFHLQRLLGGRVMRSPPVEIVLAIQAATDDRVVPQMWRKETLRADEPGEIPEEPASGVELESGEHAAVIPDATGTDEA